MISLLSPSKSMNMDPAAGIQYSQPHFLADSQELINAARELSVGDIKELMKVSDKIAELNFERFQSWSLPFTEHNAKQAAFAFTGDVYDGLSAHTLTPDDLNYAQQHLKILSGLYGVLNPLDLIQPYRLEMGRKLTTQRGTNLYQYWGSKLTERLNKAPGKYLVNLASDEYFKAIKKKELSKTVITPVFKDEKKGIFKIISFYAKRARGMMARYIIENKIDAPNQLEGFDIAGYTYSEEQSTDTKLVFTRPEQ